MAHFKDLVHIFPLLRALVAASWMVSMSMAIATVQAGRLRQSSYISLKSGSKSGLHARMYMSLSEQSMASSVLPCLAPLLRARSMEA